MNTLTTTKILGTNVSTQNSDYVLKYIIKRLKEGSEKFYIVTPNPEIMMHALSDRSYQKVLNGAQVSIPDGIGVLMASRLLKKGVEERISGIDMMLSLVEQCAKEGLTVGFFGGGSGVADKTADCLMKKFPGLVVNYVGESWNEEGFTTAQKYHVLSSKYHAKEQIQNTKYKIHNTKIDILFVALGFPRQEEWIAENLESIPVTCAMGVGGSFDFISGKVIRAPRFLRKAGFEWLFRLIMEPWRLKRQLSLPIFGYYVIRERMKN